jgi:hypothetical protein
LILHRYVSRIINIKIMMRKINFPSYLPSILLLRTQQALNIRHSHVRHTVE